MDTKTPSSSGRSDMINAVSQLVFNVSSGTTSQVDLGAIAIQDVLAQLETTDENFHSYELVRTLRARVEKAVGTMVDARLEAAGDDHNAVASITNEVLNSTEYGQMYQTFVSDLRTAVDEMLADDSLLSQPPSDQGDGLNTSTCSSATQYFNLDDSACTSELLSVHQTGLMFMSPEQLQSIADALHASQSLQVRIDGMRHLLQFPSGDLVGCDNWTPLNTAVRKCLMDDSKQLSDMCLVFYNRMYAAHLSTTTRCVYLSLAEELMTHFHGNPVTAGPGIDVANTTNAKLLEMFRLLNHIQHNLPSFWLRYNDTVVKAVISVTFDLLTLNHAPGSAGPIYFLSLLDPRAIWFRKWMHGQYSRTFVMEAMRENPTMIQDVVCRLMGAKAVSSSKPSKQRSARLRGLGDEQVYTDKTLEFAKFTHHLSLLEKLLLYKEGRRMFPVTIKKTNVSVSIADVLSHLLTLLYSVNHSSNDIHDPLESLRPRYVISHLFEELASGNTDCREMLCDIQLISLMIEPLTMAASTTQAGISSSNEVMTLLGEVVSMLAVTDNGRHCLLYGRCNKLSEAPVHVIVKFVIDALTTFTRQHQSTNLRSREAIAWLSVCRHLYNTSHGLLVIERYQLHRHIATAWKKVKGSTDQSMVEDSYSLEESLIDNLLNFAVTPKGMLLLYQSGLMSTCTVYMCERYKLKLQVSKHEKFGYGCMVTQLASTTAGISELNKCGFISMLVQELWTLLDEGDDDYRLTAPRAHPLDPMDRASHKAIINLLNVLSSYPALYEVLQKPSTQPSTSPSNSPSTVFDLLDTLVMVDSEEKKKRLLNYQEAHLFGLRIVSTLVTCLDSLLYLENQYHLTEALFSLQKDGRLENGSSDIDSDLIVVDECSIERNRLLVACHFVGGPTERALPPHYLTKVSDEYCWPLFSSYPPPSVYQAALALRQSDGRSKSALLRQLKTVPPSDKCEEWLSKTRTLFQAEIRDLSQEVMSTMLLRVVAVLSKSQLYAVFPAKAKSLSGESTGDTSLTTVEELGVEMVLRYGQMLGLLQPSHHDKPLTQRKDIRTLLKRVKNFLRKQQHTCAGDTADGMRCGFDWFTSSIFLLTTGSLKSSTECLEQLSTLIQSVYMWTSRAYYSVHLPVDVASSGISPTTYVTSHFVDYILQSEVPLVSSAIRMCGYAVSQICQHWLRQCFWNFFDWPEISRYLTVCILYGVDYQVYYCVSVLKYLEFKILQHTQEQDLIVFLKEESLDGYRCADWMEFMGDLEKKFRDTVLKEMRKLL
ncbi:protein broad-minded-like isoform X2 [Halichondria panicea]|uniref:protein broad-minded-like isoform X2 n=1 Tax=Halichondria panicea TaxID=6063 RepID=UPI00312B5ACC